MNKSLLVVAVIFTVFGAIIDNLALKLKDAIDKQDYIASVIPRQELIDTIVVSHTKAGFTLSKTVIQTQKVCFITNHSLGEVRYRIYVAGRNDRLMHDLVVREKDLGAWFDLKYAFNKSGRYALHLQALDIKGNEINQRFLIVQKSD